MAIKFETILNEYDIDLSSNNSFVDEENVVLSGETPVIGNITIWELAGIFLTVSVILIFVLLMLFKLIKYFNSYDEFEGDTQRILNTSENYDSIQIPMKCSKTSSKAANLNETQSCEYAKDSPSHLILSAQSLNRKVYSVDLYKESGIDCPKDSYA